MTKEELAKELNGMEYGDNPAYLLQVAKENRLVIVTGYSDDCLEFQGALNEEFGCYAGGPVRFTKTGNVVTDDHLETIDELKRDLGVDIFLPTNEIVAIYGSRDPVSNWIFKTDIPHATFKVYEDDNLYCIGLIFNLSDLK